MTEQEERQLFDSIGNQSKMAKLPDDLINQITEGKVDFDAISAKFSGKSPAKVEVGDEDPEPQPEPSSTESGDQPSAADSADAGNKGTKKRKTWKEVNDELNTVKQRFDSLPHKLRNNPEFRKQWFKDNNLTDTLIPDQPDVAFDKHNPVSGSNVELLMKKVEELEGREKNRLIEEANREREQAIDSEVNGFLKRYPELAPEGGSWKSLNEQLSKCYDYANGDTSKFDDPKFAEEAAKKGIKMPKDKNFENLCGLWAKKANGEAPNLETAFRLTDEFEEVVVRRQQQKTPAQVANAPVQAPEPRRANILGTPSAPNKTGESAETAQQRLAWFSKEMSSHLGAMRIQRSAALLTEYEQLLRMCGID